MSVYARLARIGTWLSAPACPLCGAAIERGADFCDGCERSLPLLGAACARCAVPLPQAEAAPICGQCQQHPPPYGSVQALFRYAAPVDRLIQGGKYGGRLDWLALLGRRLARHVAPRRAEVDALVTVPLHRSRLWRRGYNQSLELARPVARELNLPRLEGLVRTRATPAQAELPAAERRRNVQDAFAARLDYGGRRVALLDDVMTSGATVEAAARCLRQAGAASVEVWVVARA